MPIPLIVPIGAALIGGVAAGAAAGRKKPAAPRPTINTFMQYQPEPTTTEAEQASKQGLTDQQKKIAAIIILAVLGFVIYKYIV